MSSPRLFVTRRKVSISLAVVLFLLAIFSLNPSARSKASRHKKSPPTASPSIVAPHTTSAVPPAPAQTRTIVLNSGYDQWLASPALINVGQQDNEWRVIFDTTNQPPPRPPATGRPADVVSDNIWASINPSLPSNFPNSRWISIKPNQGQPLPTPPSKFQYVYYFTLPPGFSNPVLTMKLSADDHITKVTLNSTTLFQGSGGIFAHPPLVLPTSPPTSSSFNSGPVVNVITVDVEDTGGVITGLIVDGTVTYEDCDRLPIRDIANLASITFWESSSVTPTQYTFAASDPKLTTRRSDPLGPSNNFDFEGVPGAEFYDVFYSDWNGAPNPIGQFVTIEAVWPVGAPSGGGLNIARVDFNGTGKFANSVASFVALGNNAMPDDVGKAVDLDPNVLTDTTMGNTIGTTQRIRVTVGFPCCTPPPSGMVAWWPMDETASATSLQDIIGGNNATPFAPPVGAAQGPQPVPGQVRGAMQFPKFGNGLSGARVSPQGALGNIGAADFTIDAWVKVPPAPANRLHYIVNKFDSTQNRGYALYVVSPGIAGNERLEFKWGDGTNVSTVATISPLTTGQWHHVAVSFARNVGTFALDIRLYVDGAQQGQQAGNPPGLGSLVNFLVLEIGWQPGTIDEPITIDELEIFDRALLRSEIQSIFNVGSGGKCQPCPTITINPATLVNQTWGTNVAYPTLNLTATGGAGPYTFAVTNGSLPAGIILDSNGTLHGTPVTAGTYVFTVRGTDANGCPGERRYQIVIVLCPPVTLNPAAGSLPTAGINTPYSQTFAATGGCGSAFTYGVTSGALPTGLTLSTSGVLFGTATQQGVSTFTVTATDSCGCSKSQTYTLKVDCPTVSLPLFNTGVGNNGSLLASGATDPHYALILPNGNAAPAQVLASVPSSYVPNSAISTWIGPGVSIDTVGQYTYRVTFTLTGCDPSSVVINGQWASDNQAVIRVNNVNTPFTTPNNGFGQFSQFSLNSTNASFKGGLNTLDFVVTNNEGPTGLRVEMTGSVKCCGCITAISLNPAAGALPATLTGTAYNQTFTAAGGDCGSLFTYSVTNGSLPSGLTLGTNGVLSGLPTQPGNFTFTVTATDSCGCSKSQTYTSKVDCPIVPLPVFNTGVADDGSLLASGATDPHYVMLNTSPIFPAALVPPASQITSYFANGPNSQWLGPNISQLDNSPVGFYTYRTTFTLDAGCDPSTITLSGQWASDNEAEIFLNGPSTGFMTGPSAFTAFTPFAIPTGFISGVNILDFRVRNRGVGGGTTPTATGLRVEMIGKVKCCPACATPPPGMVAWWPLDEPNGATVVNDIAGVNNQGTSKPGSPLGSSNAPIAVPGKVSGAVNFDSNLATNGPNIEVPSHTEINFGTGSLSIDAWVFVRRPQQSPVANITIHPIVDKLQQINSMFTQGRGYAFYLVSLPSTGARLQFAMGDGGGLANYLGPNAPSVPYNAWTHVAVTVNRGSATVAFYVNGVPVPVSSPVPSMPAGTVTNTRPLLIGESRLPNRRQAFITLDELEMFNRALSTTEIRRIFNAGSVGKCKCLVASNDAITCGPNGTFTYTFTLRNLSNFTATGVNFSSSSGITITPSSMTISALAPGASTNVTLAIGGSGAVSGANVCFSASLMGSALQSANADALQLSLTDEPRMVFPNPVAPVCSVQLCIALPNCQRQLGTSGRVIDTQGRAIPGAQVQLEGRAPITTDAAGEFKIDHLPLTERLAISFSASGFVNTTRVFPIRPDALRVSDTVLQPRTPAVIINATAGGRVTFPQGGGLTIPPNSLVDPGGNLLSGNVRVSLTYLDVSDPNQIRSAPGDFTAVMRDNTVQTLESFGIFEVFVEDSSGRRADLAPGKTAPFALPIPRPKLGKVPRTTRLFNFDTIIGRWVEVGTLLLSDDGLTYNGTIDQCDWSWNADDPLGNTCIRVQVFEPHFPIPPHGPPAANAFVTATGVDYYSVSSGYTDSNGLVCLLVKRNSKVSLQARSTTNPNYQSIPVEITSPDVASGTADCGNVAACPLVQQIDLDIIVGADLFIGDTPLDSGLEKNLDSGPMWISEDIWVRNEPDPGYRPDPFPAASPSWSPLPHENPEYRDPKFSVPNYVYVRVRNRGTSASSGTERLRVYWAKASTGLGWPDQWGGAGTDFMASNCPGKPRLYGTELTKPRKNAAMATDAERKAYRDAILNIGQPDFVFSEWGTSYWHKQQEVHRVGPVNRHGSLAFLPWHREFVNRYEALLQEYDPTVKLLYWDWTKDPETAPCTPSPFSTACVSGIFNFFSPTFMGASGRTSTTGPVSIGAPFNTSPPTLAPPSVKRKLSTSTTPTANSDLNLLTKGTFGPFAALQDSFAYDLENVPNHNSAHGYIGGGGDMSSRFTAAQDPFFFLLHANVDRLWAQWQRDKDVLTRLDPATTYGDVILPSTPISTTMGPWDNVPTHFESGTSLKPWTSGDHIQSKTPMHPSVVSPPIYDCAPLVIPVLQPGQAVVMQIPWYPPNPANFDCFGGDQGHFCLLGRIETIETFTAADQCKEFPSPYGMLIPEGADINANTRNNNNIAWKNVTVVDNFAGALRQASVLVRNVFSERVITALRFDTVGDASLFENGQVFVDLKSELLRRWVERGAKGRGIRFDPGNPRIEIVSPQAFIQDIPLEAREVFSVDVRFELGMDYRKSPTTLAKFDLVQIGRPGDENAIIGGQRFDLDVSKLVLVKAGDEWRYLDDGANPGPNWTSSSFDDSTWRLGRAELGFGDEPMTTVDGGPSDSRHITTYFRRAFEVPDPSFFDKLVLRLKRDDGAVVYLNGIEVHRVNLPAGAVESSTFATREVAGLEEEVFFPIPVDPRILTHGANFVAVEVHQNFPGSTDLTFDLELLANPTFSGFAPDVAFASLMNGAMYQKGEPISINVEALDSDGEIASVSLFADGKLIGRGNRSSFSFLWQNAPLGPHRLRAVASDQDNQTGVTHITVNVVENLPPSVLLDQPGSGAVFRVGETISTVASATDHLGKVDRVEFFVSEMGTFSAEHLLVGTAKAPPFAAAIKGLPPGHYMLSAVAWDDGGLASQSNPIHFAVVGAQSLHSH